MAARIGIWISTIACLVMILSFGLWAADEGRSGSNTQVAKINDSFVTAPPTGEAAREKAHSALREHIDDVNDVLASPFSSVSNSDNGWAKRLIPLVLGLLLYGVAFRFLLTYLPK